jgi:hypothetical protein
VHLGKLDLHSVSVFDRLLKNSRGILRQAQDERRSFDISDDFPVHAEVLEASELF